MNHDAWLDRWLPLILERAKETPVLEIGCGSGEDTFMLTNAGARVVAFDLSSESVLAARQRVPQSTIHCQDVRAPFPETGSPIGVIIASLSLHYFPWSETVALIERVHEHLRPGGLFLCRLNSTNDHHFGASGHPQIEPHYYQVDGRPKRFFDPSSIDQLFAEGWRRISTEEYVTPKYSKPKVLWEIVLERE